jgi:hypothetical protein
VARRAAHATLALLLASALAGTTLGAQGVAPPAPLPRPTVAQPPSPYLGHWQGALPLGAVALRLGLSVRADSAGALSAVVTSLDQGNTQTPAQLTVRGDTLVAAMPAIGATFSGTLVATRDTLRGSFQQNGAGVPLVLVRVPAIGRQARRQDPKPPFPYRSDTLAVASTGSVRLACTVVTPQGRGPFPAAVLVTGSGPQDRDETLFDHRPFLVLADHLARRGVATLRCDDRGVGGSTGSVAGATTADFADDAEAMVRALRARPEVARERVGIIGHSEGGTIGPIVAARTRDVSFLVLLAGTGVRGDSVLVLQQLALMRSMNVPAPMAAQAVANNRRLLQAVATARNEQDAVARYDSVTRALAAGVPTEARAQAEAQLQQGKAQATSPWMRHFLTLDPQAALRRVRVPVLALNGTLDTQVTWQENLGAIRTALAAGGNRDHKELELPGLNHLFQTARSGLPQEYVTLDETIAPVVLETIAGWIQERFGRR